MILHDLNIRSAPRKKPEYYNPPFAMITYRAGSYRPSLSSQIAQVSQPVVPQVEMAQSFSSSQQTTFSMPQSTRRSISRTQVTPTAMASYQNLRVATRAEKALSQQISTHLAATNTNCLVSLNSLQVVDNSNNLVSSHDLHLVSSAGSFRNNQILKTNLNAQLSNSSLIHSSSSISERDHGLISPYSEGLGISREDCGTVFLTRDQHKDIGFETSQELPLSIDYVTGSIPDLLDEQQSRYKKSVIEVFVLNSSGKYSKHDLDLFGIYAADIIEGSEFAFNIDRQNVSNKNINKHLYLPICHNRMIAGKATSDLNRFVAESVKQIGTTYDPVVASQTLIKGLENILDVRQHYYAVASYVNKGSNEYSLLYEKNQDLVAAIHKAVEFTTDRGGSIPNSLVKQLESSLPLPPIDLLAAEQLARNDLGLTNVKNGIQGFFADRVKVG